MANHLAWWLKAFDSASESIDQIPLAPGNELALFRRVRSLERLRYTIGLVGVGLLMGFSVATDFTTAPALALQARGLILDRLHLRLLAVKLIDLC